VSGSRRPPEPRRQARGLARIESILDVAEAVFAEVGYEATTTNLIAARAGISPGSLYQYFANKQAIAEALAERYLASMAVRQSDVFDEALVGLALPELADRVIDPMLAFTLAHPSTKTFINSANMAPELVASSAQLRASLVDRMATLIGRRTPALSPRDRDLLAAVSVHLYASFVPLIIEATPRRRERIVRELKAVLVGYWSGFDGDGGRFRPSAVRGG
jgi:AcrR family transcriptional regulator